MEVMLLLVEAALNLIVRGEPVMSELLAAVPADLLPGILKTTRLGYDGKGQVRVADRAALEAYQKHPEHAAIKPFMSEVVSGRHCMDYEI